MRCLSLALTFALLTAWAAAARTQDLPFAKETQYAEVRSALIKQRWEPVIVPYPEPTRCDEWDQFCTAYPEFLGCRVALWDPCDFVWRRPDHKLVVIETTMDAKVAPKTWRPLYEESWYFTRADERYYFHPRPAWPRFRMHTPYPEVRRGMIAQGYVPVSVTRRERDEVACVINHMCQQYPEVVHCWPTGAGFCKLLFRNSRTSKLVVVTTDGDAPEHMMFNAIGPADDDPMTTMFKPWFKPKRR